MRIGILLVLTLGLACGGGGGGDGDGGVDGGLDDGGSSRDGDVSDGSPPDGSPPDGALTDGGESDGGPSDGCGDGEADPGESCDGDDLRDLDCADVGFAGGTLGCSATCRLDLRECTATCGDGRCHRGETVADCPADCAVTDVAAGTTHTCVAQVDGSVRCFGAPEGHRMGGLPLSARPVRVPAIDDALSVCAGETHSCVRHEDGTVSCWGSNGYGQVDPASTAQDIWPPSPVAGVSGAVELVCGLHHTCVRRDGDLPLCWGRGDFMQTMTNSMRRGGLAVQDFDDMARIDVGDRHSCGLDGTGRVWCWGYGSDGAIGSGETTWTRAPILVMGRALRLATGGSHTCATYQDLGAPVPQMRCWGKNDYAQVGVPASSDPELGPRGAGIGGIGLLTAGGAHTCVSHGTRVGCFGANLYGQLGTGTRFESTPDLQWMDLEVSDLEAGDQHTCAVLTDGSVRCWGANGAGQLGTDSVSDAEPAPIRPRGL